MKNRLVRLALIFILTFVYCGFNNIEAKDIKIRVTLSDDKSEAYFVSMIGAFTKEVNHWNQKGWNYASFYNGNLNENGAHKEYYNDNKTYTTDFGGNLLNNFDEGTVRSYSILIHNKPFSKYSNASKKYGYVDDYSSKITKYTSPVGKNDNVKSIELARLSSYYTLLKCKDENGRDAHINVLHNKISNEYLNKLKEEFKSNFSDVQTEGEQYIFYVSEPLAWKYPGSTIVESSKRKIWENVANTFKNEERNVGILTASEVNDININKVGFSNYKNIADLFNLSRNYIYRWNL